MRRPWNWAGFQPVRANMVQELPVALHLGRGGRGWCDAEVLERFIERQPIAVAAATGIGHRGAQFAVQAHLRRVRERRWLVDEHVGDQQVGRRVANSDMLTPFDAGLLVARHVAIDRPDDAGERARISDGTFDELEVRAGGIHDRPQHGQRLQTEVRQERHLPAAGGACIQRLRTRSGLRAAMRIVSSTG